LGSSPNAFRQPQNIFVRVESSTWHSSPMTVSSSAMTRGSLSKSVRRADEDRVDRRVRLGGFIRAGYRADLEELRELMAESVRIRLDDCAEFFCIPYPDSLSMHFVFEVNMNKAAMDCIVLWKYHDNRSFFIWDYNPQYEVGVTSDGTINNDKDNDKAWTMEFAIPFKVFSNFSPAKVGTKWAFQACRQDRNKVDDRFRSTSTLFPTYDIKLDVHPPNRFGLMEFTDN